MTFPAWILAIDPGKNAGAALFVRGVLIESWQVKPGGESAIVAEAVVRAEGEPLVVVRENWMLGGRRKGDKTRHQHIGMLPGLGVAWGRWEGALLNVGVPASRIVKVYSRTWQSRVLSGRVLTRESAIAIAKERASTLAHRDVGEDEAVAICIGIWATEAPDTLAALSVAEGKVCGVDVHAARRVVSERAKARKAQRRRA